MKNFNSAKAVELLNRILAGTKDDLEIKEFFGICCELSKILLLTLKKRGFVIDNSWDTIDSLTIDMVVKLFGRRQGRFYAWEKYAKQQGLPKEETILVFMRRLVYRKTQQELTYTFKERNPEAARNARREKMGWTKSWVSLEPLGEIVATPFEPDHVFKAKVFSFIDRKCQPYGTILKDYFFAKEHNTNDSLFDCFHANTGFSHEAFMKYHHVQVEYGWRKVRDYARNLLNS